MEKRHNLRSDVQVMLIRDHSILLLLRQNTGYQDGHYGLPAGHVEPGESIVAAAAREGREEAGLDLKENGLIFNQVMHRRSDVDYISFFFIATDYNGPEPQNTEPEKCVELKWFDLDNLPQNIIPWVKLGIDNYRNNIVYSEFNF